MAGLPAAGKTALARELAARTSGRIIGKDEIRHAIFAADEIEYSTRQDDFCMDLMLQMAAFLFQQNSKRLIFLDGRPFSRRYQIDNVIAAAESFHQPWRILECVCSEETARRRLEGDESGGAHPAQNRNSQLYLESKSSFESILQQKTVIDTEQPLADCVEHALSALR